MWNDDDRTFSPVLMDSSVCNVEDKEEHIAITDILRELIQEERERMYESCSASSEQRTPRQSPKSSKRFTYVYVDESDDAGDYYSSDDEDTTTVTKDTTDRDDDLEECSSTTPPDMMTRIIEDQIYRRFGYV